MKEADFNSSERQLMAEVARRLTGRDREIVSAWTAAIPFAAPADRLPAMRRALVELAREPIASFFDALSASDPPRALAVIEEFCAQLIRDRRPEGADHQRLTIEDLVRASQLLREIVDREIALTFEDKSARATAASLAYARFWILVSEALAVTYSRLYDDEVRRHQGELSAARDAALEASQIKSAFVANMTHEIRTPLNVILGYADLMAERLAEMRDESSHEYGEPIRRAGQRLLGTIGAVLDLSRIESGAFELKPTSILLAHLVERHVQDLSVLARKKGLTLECQIEEPAARVIFDEHCLSNTIINLLQNAIKFTDGGGVFVRLFRDGTGVLSLAIRDSGRGIDAPYLPHLFEPFSREGQHALPAREGAGLGLALVKRYVELNRGQIAVASARDAGTTFTVTFFEDTAARTTG